MENSLDCGIYHLLDPFDVCKIFIKRSFRFFKSKMLKVSELEKKIKNFHVA
jgi:hypothetical protein